MLDLGSSAPSSYAKDDVSVESSHLSASLSSITKLPASPGKSLRATLNKVTPLVTGEGGSAYSLPSQAVRTRGQKGAAEMQNIEDDGVDEDSHPSPSFLKKRRRQAPVDIEVIPAR